VPHYRNRSSRATTPAPPTTADPASTTSSFRLHMAYSGNQQCSTKLLLNARIGPIATQRCGPFT
jgi:hypothetical protein